MPSVPYGSRQAYIFFVDNLGWLELARAAAILSQPFNSETLTKQRKNQQH